MPELLEENTGLSAIQSHPADEIPDDNEPPQYGERNEDLPEQLVTLLRETVKTFNNEDYYDRRREILRDLRNRLYERGFQHFFENPRTGYFSIAGTGSVVDLGGSNYQTPNYNQTFEIFQPSLAIKMAVLTQTVPGVKFEPDDPSRGEDIEAADTGEGYKIEFARQNDLKSVCTKIARFLGVSGRVVSWTHDEANAQRYGLDENGEPKEFQTTKIVGTLETKVPITASCQDAALYCFISDDPHVRLAKSEYPNFKKEIKAGAAGIGENQYERWARLGIMQGMRSHAQIGEALAHVVTRMNCWLRPAAFEGDMYDEPLEVTESDDDMTADPETGVQRVMTCGEKLDQLFPSGCHCVFVGDTYVGSWDESMDDAIHIDFPYEGEGMFRKAYMDPAITFQDQTNDNQNAFAELVDHGWPQIWVNGEEQDYDAIASQRSDPAGIQVKKARSSMSMEQEIFKEPDLVIPQTVTAWDEDLRGPFLQFVLATPPALFGGAMDDQKTASGYAQARAQAMGVNGPIYSVIKRFMARIYKQAAMLAAKSPQSSKPIVIPTPSGGTQTLQFDKMRKGNFRTSPKEDSSNIPENNDVKRQNLGALLALAEQSPDIAAQLVGSPDNWEILQDIYGIPDLVLVEATARNKQVLEIEELLLGSPLPPDPQMLEQAQVQHAAATIAAQATGGPPPPPFDPQSLLQPSIPVKPLDFHPYEGKKGQEWLSGEECRRQLTAGNQMGVLNVELHTKAHLKMAVLMAPPPMPAGPPMKKPQPPQAQGPQGAPNNIAAPPGAPGAPTM